MEGERQLEIYTVRNLTFTYPGREKPALDGLSLSVRQGEFTVLCGSSGCGKTTLLRHLKPGLTPHGTVCTPDPGRPHILFEGGPIGDLSPRDAAARIGFVMQCPENQIVTDKVWHELAFGMESLGFRTPEIRRRVAEMAGFFGIEAWFRKNVAELSGGQKQMLNLAGIMAMQPSVLILDEPTSQLDPIAAAGFLDAVGKINRELGTTVILTEHRLEEALPHADRVLVMERGAIICGGTPSEAGMELRGRGHGMFAAMPVPMRVYAAVDSDGECPVTVRDGRSWLQRQPIAGTAAVRPIAPASEDPKIELSDLWFKYGRDLPDVIKGLSFKAYPGEVAAILGGNGTGKTTALNLVMGLVRPYRGKIKTNGTVAALPQNPQVLFVKSTVAEDLEEMLRGTGLTKRERQERICEAVGICGLEGLTERHPYDLSGGEQQRAALAKVLLLRPEILLLDEPTKGLDAEFKRTFAGVLRRLADGGAAVLIVSHDIEFCAEYTDRCALFFDGSVVSEGTPREFFAGNSFYTTAANRMSRGIIDNAVIAEDIIVALGGNPSAGTGRGCPAMPCDGGTGKNGTAGSSSERVTLKTPHSGATERVPVKRIPVKRAVASLLMVLVAVPLTVYAGNRYFGDRKYFFISLLIILETMIPFALIFESRKPRARELIVIAVLCAIAVAGRAAFFMVPQFKPVAAIVIISGAALGGEAGFLVGAMTAFVSNMFMGQGPWSPYQMFAFGVIGFLAGILFKNGATKRKKAALCIFGFLSVFLIYGGIMNPASVLLFQSAQTWGMFAAAYIRGIPYDAVHASATVFFLLAAAGPMLEKLDRIKLKYGMAE